MLSFQKSFFACVRSFFSFSYQEFLFLSIFIALAQSTVLSSFGRFLLKFYFPSALFSTIFQYKNLSPVSYVFLFTLFVLQVPVFASNHSLIHRRMRKANYYLLVFVCKAAFLSVAVGKSIKVNTLFSHFQYLINVQIYRIEIFLEERR